MRTTLGDEHSSWPFAWSSYNDDEHEKVEGRPPPANSSLCGTPKRIKRATFLGGRARFFSRKMTVADDLSTSRWRSDSESPPQLAFLPRRDWNGAKKIWRAREREKGEEVRFRRKRLP